MDIFSRILNKGKDHGLIEGLRTERFNFINIQFAVNILLSVTHIEKLRNLKLLIYLFENMTGLSISFHMSMAIWLDGFEDQQKV